MITFTKAYQTSDGTTHASLEEAKQAELTSLFNATTPMENQSADAGCPWLEEDEVKFATRWMVANADKVVDILTTTKSSRPRARKSNGGSKKRIQPTQPPQEATA